MVLRADIFVHTFTSDYVAAEYRARPQPHRMGA
jgi:hypothetical protein